MPFNKTKDYALRLILYLARNAQTVSSFKLSAAIGVSPRYLLQVRAKLRDAELIVATHGPAGGYDLKKPPIEISLFDIILIMEERQKSKPGSEDIFERTEFRILDTAYGYVDEVLREILKSITIESHLSESVETWYLAPFLLKGDVNYSRLIRQAIDVF